MNADPEQLVDVLERFEREAWRMRPAYAERVRQHLKNRLGLSGHTPVVVALEELEPDPEPSQPVAVLVVQEGTVEEAVIPLGEGLTLGRGKQNDLMLRGDSKISRFHCRVFFAGERWWVEDTGSTNHTLVNGEILEPHQPRALFGGEELIVGETFLRVRLRDTE